MPSRTRKAEYFTLMKGLLAEYTKAFLVQADHVGSKQFQDIRKAMRGVGHVLMGKNTMMRKILRGLGEDSPYAVLPELIVGNVGLIFVKNDLAKAKDIVNQYTVPARLVLVLLPTVTCPSPLARPVAIPPRPVISRLWKSPPRLPRVRLRSSVRCTSSPWVTV